MRRLFYWLSFATLAALLLASRLYGQSIPVTGHAFDSSQGIPAGMSVKFELYNCGGNYPRVFGSFGIIKQNFTIVPDPNGLLTGTIVPNDAINCGGVAGTTRYNVTILLNGVPQLPTACYPVLSTMGVFNLDTATPCASATPPPPPGGPFDATYNNLTLLGLLSGGNAVFSGSLIANSFHFQSDPFRCPAGQYSIGPNIDFLTQCVAFPAAATVVTSFNGRQNAVSPASGDYSCGMVTGCPPTLNFASPLSLSGATVSLSTVGAGGSATCPTSITFDVFGRITAITPGSCTSGSTFTQTDVTGSRSLSGTFQNTTGHPVMVQGYIVTTAGGADGNITCSNGPTSGLGNSPFSENPTSTDANGNAEFHLSVPTGWFYQCTATGSMNPALGKWYETVLQ